MPFTPFLAVLGPQDLLDMLIDTTLLGKIVLLLLLILSVLSWAVMFDKGRSLSRIRKGHREFWQRLASWREGREPVTSLTAWCEERVDLPLANLWLEAAPQKSAVMVRRACERTAYAETEELERYLIILSTTVTIAPFLGLMGTVWGIMQSFTEMGSGTNTTLNLIGPGIAEALITTIAASRPPSPRWSSTISSSVRSISWATKWNASAPSSRRR